MEIVIKIPKDVKGVIDRNGTNEIVAETLWQAVKNGTPVPKYGKLIDYYDAIELINNKADEENSNFTISDIEKFGALLREVNPIIEADKESEDAEHGNLVDL